MKTHFWWVLQTYLTAFGEGNELDDDDDWITLVIGMTVLLVLQLILKDTVQPRARDSIHMLTGPMLARVLALFLGLSARAGLLCVLRR